jgi:hypothetical protein
VSGPLLLLLLLLLRCHLLASMPLLAGGRTHAGYC